MSLVLVITTTSHTCPTPSSSGVLGTTGQVMPGHSVDVPTDKTYRKDTKPVGSHNQHRLKCTVTLCRASFQQLSTAHAREDMFMNYGVK